MSALPPEGAAVDLPRGRYRAIIVRPGPDGRVELRGWWMDRPLVDRLTIPETTIVVGQDEISGWDADA